MTELDTIYEWAKSTLAQAREAPSNPYKRGYTDALREFIEWFEYEFDYGED